MSDLRKASPILASDLEKGLVELDRRDLVEQVLETAIAKCTFGDDQDVGYVYFERRPYPVSVVHNESAPVAVTISISIYDLFVDIDHEGDVFGVEYVCRSDIWAELRAHSTGE